MAPHQRRRRERAGLEALVAVDVRREEVGQLAHVRHPAGQERRERRREAAVVGREEAAVALPEREVDVARVALALVVLRDERERVALLERDLLGAVAVHGVAVGHRQRLVVAEVDLVLADDVALALGVLDVQPGAVHLQPQPAQQRLDVGGAEDGVVDVVAVGRPQPAVALGARALVRLLEEDELELGGRARGPAALGEPVELAPQDLAAATAPPACRRATPGRTAPAPCPGARCSAAACARSGRNTKSP